ncbi:MAG: hypothetical protein F4X26_07825 [Chloroflexi bacterium]|nr:hypothetical protein [Chloroflexota bacterium]
MPVIVVAGEPGAGATTVAVGLAHRIAHSGRSVRLARLGDDGRAAADAATFGLLDFAEAVDGADIASGSDAVTVVEVPAGADAGTLAAQQGARLVTVGRGDSEAPGGAVLHLMTHADGAGPLRIPEDRTLAAPMVGELVEASRAQVVVRSIEGDAAICRHIVVGPIAPVVGDDYFGRYPDSAVVTRAEKVDVALAAMRVDPVCLILSGGSEPSPYLLDRVAASRSTTLLVAPEGTVETVRDIEGSFGRSPFGHEAKVERIGELMAAAVDDDALATLLGG